jgi:hypothetical protein
MITLDKFFEFAVNEMHHWMRMSDISDNDVDRRYFDGRSTIDDKFVYKATDYESIDQIVYNLDDFLLNVVDDNEMNMYFKRGQLDELRLLLKIINKNYES